MQIKTHRSQHIYISGPVEKVACYCGWLRPSLDMFSLSLATRAPFQQAQVVRKRFGRSLVRLRILSGGTRVEHTQKAGGYKSVLPQCFLKNSLLRTVWLAVDKPGLAMAVCTVL